MQILDISPVISPNLGVFPGDQKFVSKRVLDFESGGNFVLSSIQTTVHLGAHADSPLHYHSGAGDIASCGLSPYLGDAQVIHVNVKKGERVLPSHLTGKKITSTRVLFKTLTFDNPNSWNSDFASLSAELIEFLVKQKVILVGIDTPSVDLEQDKILESHNAIYKADMRILEGLVLTHIEEGAYKLIALPLKMSGIEASPVRAVLIRGEL